MRQSYQLHFWAIRIAGVEFDCSVGDKLIWVRSSIKNVGIGIKAGRDF